MNLGTPFTGFVVTSPRRIARRNMPESESLYIGLLWHARRLRRRQAAGHETVRCSAACPLAHSGVSRKWEDPSGLTPNSPGMNSNRDRPAHVEIAQPPREFLLHPHTLDCEAVDGCANAGGAASGRSITTVT